MIFIESQKPELKCSHRPTFAYHGKKEMWSIIRNFPSTLDWSNNPKRVFAHFGSTSVPFLNTFSHHANVPRVNAIPEGPRKAMLFKSIGQNTQGVSIGPLEYCGNGHIPLAVCNGDPAIPQYFEECVLRGLNRISTKMEASGKRENTALKQKLSTLKAGYSRVGTLGDGENNDADGNPVKP
ncbi:hypothetical protein B0H13DRAFT_1863625 [Mycena leptocephala]|nr:hypothetical protein B0H13DRAFT_1863625 [Mycena leptocephala]